jgi:polysaccharide export outer membrane protein
VIPTRFLIALTRGLCLLSCLTAAAAAQGTGAGSSDPLRSQIAGLGLSPEQVRQRLRAAGYEPGLLDSYLSTSTIALTTPTSAMQEAVDAIARGEAEERRKAASLLAGRSDSIGRAPTSLDGIPVFGLDVFRAASTRFDPLSAGPVDAAYRLGPGDALALILSGRVELAHSLEVTRDGLVVIPQVGQLFVNGLTLGQATRLLEQRLARSYAGVSAEPGAGTQLYVTVSRLRTNQVFVLGDVVAPGSHQLPATATMLTALYAAGGPTVNGSLRQVELRRAGQVVATLDVYDYLLRGEAARDLRLEQGDVLFVPRPARRILVQGEVARAGWYEARAGEPVSSVIDAAGGFSATAARDRLLLERILPPAARIDGRERATFDVQGRQLAVFPVEDGDRIRVIPVAPRVRSRIVVTGHVWHPGPQGVAPGKTLADALVAAGGVKPGFVAEAVTILRRRDDDVPVQVAAALDASSGRPTGTVLLKEDDSIHVWSRADFRPRAVAGRDTVERRQVTVGGAVMRPGTLPWADGLTLRQAILRSGGLEEGALLSEVEVARMPADRSDGTRATVMRVPIDATFRVDEPSGLPRLATEDGDGDGGTAAEFVLQPYDVVNVLREPGFEYLGTVQLDGEVRFPGQYAIRRKGERLGDLIARAGGLTAEAYADGAVFQRRLTPDERAERQRLLAQVRLGAAASSVGLAAMGSGAPAVSPEAAVRYRDAVDAYLRQDEEEADRLNIDLRRVLRVAADRDNVEVRAGDRLTIPRFVPTVAVKGFVNAPAAVAHQAGLPLSAYVARAGGAAVNGEPMRAFVVQPNGTVEPYRVRWGPIPDGDPVPKAGSVVIVPPRDATDRRPGLLQLLGPVTQVLASVVALIAVAR